MLWEQGSRGAALLYERLHFDYALLYERLRQRLRSGQALLPRQRLRSVTEEQGKSCSKFFPSAPLPSAPLPLVSYAQFPVQASKAREIIECLESAKLKKKLLKKF
ncbi:MAG: hypothetical protein V7K71_12705 [Nostoc sp.]|uniref:hypothetical protein n=1 Tax=Nostoc sp. TaxID=1180 RepID=UPI002FFA780F